MFTWEEAVEIICHDNFRKNTENFQVNIEIYKSDSNLVIDHFFYEDAYKIFKSIRHYMIYILDIFRTCITTPTNITPTVNPNVQWGKITSAMIETRRLIPRKWKWHQNAVTYADAAHCLCKEGSPWIVLHRIQELISARSESIGFVNELDDMTEDYQFVTFEKTSDAELWAMLYIFSSTPQDASIALFKMKSFYSEDLVNRLKTTRLEIDVI